MNFEFRSGIPKTGEYLALRKAVGWHDIPVSRAGEALNQSLYLCSVYDQENLIGFGRVIGDGFMYFYVQDILVDPDYQGHGIGTQIMGKIMGYLEKEAPSETGSFIGLMIAPGLESFYGKFGFEKFPDDCPGMKIWRNGH